MRPEALALSELFSAAWMGDSAGVIRELTAQPVLVDYQNEDHRSVLHIAVAHSKTDTVHAILGWLQRNHRTDILRKKIKLIEPPFLCRQFRL